MKDLEDVFGKWNDVTQTQEAPKKKIIDRVIWTPRLKWFKPPKWKIFRLAYKKTVTYLETMNNREFMDRCSGPEFDKRGN